MIAELKYGRSGKYIAARGAVARVTAMNATTTRARHRIAATIAAMMSQGMTMTMPDPDPRAPVPADHQWGDELINDARVCQRCGVRWEQGPVPRIPCLLPAPVPADPWAQVQDALYDAHDRLDHAVDAARAQAEQQHAQAIERLKQQATGYIAARLEGTLGFIQSRLDDKQLYLIEANQAEGGARMVRAYDLQPDGTVANMRVHLTADRRDLWNFFTTERELYNAWRKRAKEAEADLAQRTQDLATLQAAHTALQALCQELADRLAALTPPPAPPAPTGETP